MKKIPILLILLLALCVSAHTVASEIVIERPPFSVCNSSLVEVEKIVLTDTSTILYMGGYPNSGGSIRIVSDTYIRESGKKYMLKQAVGIPLDEFVKADESGKLSFSLIFPAIPASARQIDFVESDCAECFKIWGIELKSQTLTNRLQVPQQILDQAVVREDNQALPVPVLKEGMATLKGRILGYVPEMNTRITAYVNNPVTGNQDDYTISVGEDGSFASEMQLVSTTQVLIRIPVFFNQYILLSPDQETQLYIDMQQKCRMEAKTRIDKCEEGSYIYYGGANAEINNQLQKPEILQLMRSIYDQRTMEKEVAGMSAEQFKDFILTNLRTKEEKVSRLDMTAKAKEFLRVYLRMEAIHTLFFTDTYLEEAFRTVNKLDRTAAMEGYQSPIMDASFYSFLKELSLNNDYCLYSSMFGNNVNSCKYIREKQDGRPLSLTFHDLSAIYKQLIDSGGLSPEEVAYAKYTMQIYPSTWSEEEVRIFRQNCGDFASVLLESGLLSKKQTGWVEELKASSIDKEMDMTDLLCIYLETQASLGFANDEKMTELLTKCSIDFEKKMGEKSFSEEQAKAFQEKHGAIINAAVEKSNLEAEKRKKQKHRDYLARLLGSDEGLVFDMMLTQQSCEGFEKFTPMTEDQLKAVAELKNTFYINYLQKKNNALIAQIEENKKGMNDVIIHELAATVEGDRIMEEILKPFAGKVIFVDFWNTWCSPCRSAMKQFEPAKQQFKGKDIAFVYLADETSPLGTWENMIPTIPGNHYRLTKAQSQYLLKKLGGDGIPCYLILNKQGEQVYFKVGFEGADEMANRLNQLLVQ